MQNTEVQLNKTNTKTIANKELWMVLNYADIIVIVIARDRLYSFENDDFLAYKVEIHSTVQCYNNVTRIDLITTNSSSTMGKPWQ